MIPRQHQVSHSAKATDILNKYQIVYLSFEERTGKTLTSILIADNYDCDVLVITTRKAMDGWVDTFKRYKTKNKYTLTTHHLAYKEKAKFGVIIIDEAHTNISSCPKPSKCHKGIKPLCKGAKLIYLSATPYAQGMQLLFHQLSLSDYSPFKEFTRFTKWYEVYAQRNGAGDTDKIYISGRRLETYKKVKTAEILAKVKHLFLTTTRKELGFKHEPKDVLHFVELDPNVKLAYNMLLKKKVLNFTIHNQDKELIADSAMKLLTSLHMLEGGVLKLEDEYIVLTNNEKIDYIKSKFGDTDKIGIMHHYIAEGTKLRENFSKAIIMSASTYAEGVDLSHLETLIIYSQDFSSSKHSQRRARQANFERETVIDVHFILTKKGISEQVYKTVSLNKKNFIDSIFNKVEL